MDLSEVLDYVNDSGQPPIDDPVQDMNADATTMQPNTIEAWGRDTYLPGDRQQRIPPTKPKSPGRHAPRKDGFACTVEGCNKTFDRRCELK